MRKLLSVLCLASLGFFVSCSDDDSWAPAYITDLAELYTDASGQVATMLLDDGRTLNLEATNITARPDTTYRCVCVYTLADNGRATIYSAVEALSSEPIIDTGNLTIKTDPCEIQAIWRGGSWLNARMLVQGKDTPHIVAYVDEGIATDELTGVNILTLRLFHDQNGDQEAFTRTIYLSCPLRSYADRLVHGRDSIHFVVNQYNKGTTTLRLAY